jgi:6-phosphogluconolactonase
LDADPPARWEPVQTMNTTVFVGTYTESKDTSRSEGIFVYKLAADGRFEQVSAAEAGPNPSFLALHPGGRFLYSANEQSGGMATAFAFDPANNSLRLLNSQSTGGAGPCYLSFDPSGRWLMVSNYSGGSLAVLPVREDGRLEAMADFIQHVGSGPNADRQEQAHAHSIRMAPGGAYALACDLGIDRVLVYALDADTGKLSLNDAGSVDSRPGAGPRHLELHPNGRYVYVANELDNTVTVCSWDKDAGKLAALQNLPTLPVDFKDENTVADIHMTPSGRYLYVSNRGHNSLAAFAVEDDGASLRSLGHFPSGGDWPRNFAISPDGRYLLSSNQNSGDIIVYAIDGQSGVLTPAGHQVQVDAPVCVIFGGAASD